MSLQTIKFDEEAFELSILNQLLVPHQTSFLPIYCMAPCDELEKDRSFSGYDAIKGMYTRGAPAIMLVGCFSIVVELNQVINKSYNPFSYDLSNLSNFKSKLIERIDYLIRSRPTAVNLLNGCNEIKDLISVAKDLNELFTSIADFSIRLYQEDLASNYAIGDNGVKYIYEELEKEGFEGDFSVMTICNTGSLATSGYGTALGVIRSLHKEANTNKTSKFKMSHVYACETRPYNQGARLTSYELDFEKIPFSLIPDSSVAFLMDTLTRQIPNRGFEDMAPLKFILVGSDRIVKNGDLANKIGTFQLSCVASQYPSIKFIGAAPTTTMDFNTETGDDITIEQRPKNEMTELMGGEIDQSGNYITNEQGVVKLTNVKLAPQGIDTWNPSFDVTPHKFIDCIVTEKDYLVKDSNGEFHLQ
ncbi:hypothetical protein CANARDRAFT_25914 [[Candida] arabinofermentans NRRL YB-2248]|uniref:S-methyl-5-thioribose-1-phosphate isomerase n=1 Tax=[Candida] arabinofermentans NRRL YB-2248 TaxID=983967 RepID=A0A1E4T7F4_9ASCO|nr:hypothetical protein CANARDRAFT_25914 [[Candida] arabinofermentans NRRL YB-2248]